MTSRLLAAIVMGPTLLAAWQQPVFHGGVDVVTIDVSVTEGKRPVTTLTKADFTLQDNGVRQTLLDATREASPLDLTLHIDISGSMTPDRRASIETALEQIGATLHPEDRCRVVSFGSRIREESALRSPPIPHHFVNSTQDGTSLMDALLLAMVAAPSLGRRQLNLFLTDGADLTSFFEAPLVVDTLKFASGQTSVILVRGRPSPTRDLLNRVTSSTGGQVVEIDRDQPLSETFLAAIDDFRTSYQLRYTPAGVPQPGWHPVKVTVGKGNYAVRARQGYWK